MGGQLRRLELAPLNLELMADAEREATLDNLAALYDAVPGPVRVLHRPIGRQPGAACRSQAGRRRLRRTGLPAVRRDVTEISATNQPPTRRILIVDAATEAQLARTSSTSGKSPRNEAWLPGPSTAPRSQRSGQGSPSTGRRTRFGLGSPRVHRWSPRSISGAAGRPGLNRGWLTGLLAVDEIATASMRVRPLSRAEAMTFVTTPDCRWFARVSGWRPNEARSVMSSGSGSTRPPSPPGGRSPPASQSLRGHRPAPRGSRSRRARGAPERPCD